MNCLVVADANDIQDYIFASRRLRRIRGASRIQQHLNRVVIPRILRELGGEVVLANGGNVVGLIQTAHAPRFRILTERAFASATGSGEVTVAWVPFSSDAAFTGQYAELQQALAKGKSVRGRASAVMTPGLLAACESCGTGDASHVVSGPGHEETEAPVLLCLSCWLKEREGQRHQDTARPLARDFDDIGEQGSPINYISLVYIDLDALGKWLATHATSLDRFRDLSQCIDNLVVTAADAASEFVNRRKEDQHPLRRTACCEKILAGGDDALFVMPADLMIPFVREFRRTYDQECEIAGQSRAISFPTFSVGAVIAHSRFPIAELRTLAHTLIRSAKTCKGRHAIDYEIISASMADDPIRQRHIVKEQGHSRFRTAKPYDLDSFLSMVDNLALLKQSAPSTRIRSLYRIAYSGPDRAVFDYGKLLIGLEPISRAVLRSLVPLHFWQRHPGGRIDTKAADLAELWEFVA